MKLTIRNCVLNAIAVPNTTPMRKSDKYIVRTPKTNVTPKSIYIGFLAFGFAFPSGIISP